MLALKEQRIRTYVEGLDRALNGGIPAGHIVLLTGLPGTMKSSFAYTLLHKNAKQANLKGAYFTLEQNRRSLQRQVEGLGLEDPMAGEKISVVDLALIRKNIAGQPRKAPFLDVFLTYVRNVVEGHGANLIVIDSLDVLETVANWDDRRSSLFLLFEFLRELNVTTFLIGEASMDLRSGDWKRAEGYLADGILDLSLQPVGEHEAMRRIRCAKMRWTPHETTSFALIWNGHGFDTTRSVSVSTPK